MTDGVQLGLVGVGWWGGVLANAAKESGRAEVVTCFSRSPEGRESFAREHRCKAAPSMEALLEDAVVDGVLVATPHTTHADLVERVAEAGKHVFVEKPLTLTVADARRAIRACDRAGVILQVGHNARRHPAIRRIKQLVEAEELGVVLQLEGNRSGPAAHLPTLAPWRADPAESPAGGMAAMGTHIVDTFNFLVGPARRVSAFSANVLDVRAIDDATTVLIEYESGPLGYLGTSYFVPVTNMICMYGTDGAAWSEQDATRLFIQKRADSTRIEQAVETLDTVADEIGEFALCIQEGGAPETGGPEGVEVAAVMEAIVRSAETGCAVELSDLR